MNQKNINFFKNNSYCIIKNAISEELINFITQYALFDEMQNFNPDSEQVVGAHSRYADPAMETMLLHLHSLMEAHTGLALEPTYSFYRVYRPDDELVTHKDRPSCEISCTLCINYDYADADYSWPIFMDGNKVILNPGDLVIYRGCDLSHWRDKFIGVDTDWHIQGFFHYVDKNGPNADWKFDKRSSIGELAKKKNLNQPSNKTYIHFTN
jgi:hypothetical protein